MRVLFVALGGNRKRAVTDESADVIASGGSAVVLVDDAAPWASVSFADGVEVVQAARIAAAHWPRRVESLVLYRGPQFVMHRAAGRGTPRARRLVKAYQRRVADRVHRRLFLPLYAKVFGGRSERAVEQRLARLGPFDLLVVADVVSLPDVHRLLKAGLRVGGKPRVAFTIDEIAVG
jgi:hypothetical protein